MKVREVDRYTYHVTWSEEDQEYLGVCDEFPSLSWLTCSQDAALRGIRRVVDKVREDMEANKEEIPAPLASGPYSGWYVIRLPADLHQKLDIEAAELGISLNRLVCKRLSK